MTPRTPLQAPCHIFSPLPACSRSTIKKRNCATARGDNDVPTEAFIKIAHSRTLHDRLGAVSRLGLCRDRTGGQVHRHGQSLIDRRGRSARRANFRQRHLRHQADLGADQRLQQPSHDLRRLPHGRRQNRGHDPGGRPSAQSDRRSGQLSEIQGQEARGLHPGAADCALRARWHRRQAPGV